MTYMGKKKQGNVRQWQVIFNAPLGHLGHNFSYISILVNLYRAHTLLLSTELDNQVPDFEGHTVLYYIRLTLTTLVNKNKMETIGEIQIKGYGPFKQMNSPVVDEGK